MKKILILRVLLSVLSIGSLSFCVFASEDTPKFEDFPVNEIFTGKNAKPAKGLDKSFIKILARPVNFSGNYIVYFNPCGGGCIMGGIINAKTGAVVENFPDQYDVDSFELYYRINSSLLVITGESANEVTGVQTKFYKFINEDLVLIKETSE